MNILITCPSLCRRQGAELYTLDLALELQRQGHLPAVFAASVGPIADELRSVGIPVISRLRSLPFRPDIIHGNSRRETLAAILRFRATPAIFVCHAHAAWDTSPRFHPRILRYLGMSQLCVERLRTEGMPENRIQLGWNWVDLERFRPRPPLPARPCRALVFSNYAKNTTHLPAITDACRQAGLALDVIGAGVKNTVAHPEEILGQYDLVFAKAKAAMEAMAVGTAVVLCDYGGVGPLVTSSEFNHLRTLNFGYGSLRNPLQPEHILHQIERYDAVDAVQVRDLLRCQAGLTETVSQLLTIYHEVLREYTKTAQKKESGWAKQYALLAWDTLLETLLLGWLQIPVHRRDYIGNSPVVHGIKNKLYEALYGGNYWNAK